MTPQTLTLAPSPPAAGAPETDLLVYAGRLLETPAGLAHAVLEYAHAMARRGTAELVTLPIFHDGLPHEVRLLVGGSVPVAALSSSDREPTSEAEAVLEDLKARTPGPPPAEEARLADHEDPWGFAAYSEWEY